MWSIPGRLGGVCVIASALAITLGSGVAEAKPASTKTAKTAHEKGKAKGPQSIGPPNAGHLAGAVRLRGSRTLRQRENAHSWGLPALTRLLHHVADDVARKHRGSQMLVGDLSGRTGGPLEGHNSHQTGRDADVGFYVMNLKGKPVAVKHFVSFDATGHGRELPWAYFDETRNWTMVESMLKDGKANVRYLFIADGLRTKLLAHAARKHVSKELIARAASVMMSPRDADLHDNHVHVRIACPESMHDVCVEEASVREPAAHADPETTAPVTMGETPKPPAPPVTMGETPKPPAPPVTMGETPKPPAPPVTMGETPKPPAPPVDAPASKPEAPAPVTTAAAEAPADR